MVWKGRYLLINLFFSDSAAGTIAFGREVLGIERGTIYSLDLKLHAGDISLPFSIEKRRDVYNSYFELESVTQGQIKKLENAMEKENEICFWYSRKDVDEYLGMLAVLSQYNGKGITFYKCDCSDHCERISCIHEINELIGVQQVKMSNDEVALLLDEWKHLQKQNTALRLLKDGKITSYPEDYIDERIYSIIGDKEFRVAYICEHLLKCNDMSAKLAFILSRIRQLIGNGKLLLTKEGYTSADAHYGEPMKDIMKCYVKINDNN